MCTDVRAQALRYMLHTQSTCVGPRKCFPILPNLLTHACCTCAGTCRSDPYDDEDEDEDDDDCGGGFCGGFRLGYAYSDEDEDDYDGCGYGYDDSEDDDDLFGLRRSIMRAVERFDGHSMQTSRPAPRPHKVTRQDVPMAVLLPGDLDIKGGAAEDTAVRKVRAQGSG